MTLVLVSTASWTGCGSEDQGADAMIERDAMTADAMTADAMTADAMTADAMMSAPTGAIVFPPRRALTDQLSVRVRGTAEGDRAIAAVRVNGVTASSLDDVGNWQVDVPLAIGENTLTLAIEDVAGQITSAADDVEIVVSQAALELPRDLALDDGQRTLYVVDEALRAVVAIDLATGVRTRISDAALGSGPALGALRAIDLDLAAGRALVIDDSDAVIAVDLVTGSRSYLTSASVGTGPSIVAPHAVVVDAEQSRALLVDAALDALLAVSLTTGDRTIIAAPGTGTGIDLIEPRDLVLDPAHQRVLLVDESLDAMLAIDLATGDRTIVSDDATGAGIRFDRPISIALAPTPGHALVIDRNRNGLLRVDLATGDRQLVSSGVQDIWKTYEGAGPLYGTAEAVVVDPLTGNALVLDSFQHLVIPTDPLTGRRSFLWGDAALNPNALVKSRDDNQLFAVDGNISGVVVTDLLSGVTTLVSNDDRGTGPAVIVPHAAVVDGKSGRLLFTDSIDFDADDWYSALTSVDIATGDRVNLSETGFSTIGTGPALKAVQGLVMLNDRIIVTSDGLDEDCNVISLIDIAPATGDRTFVSQTNNCDEPTVGTGGRLGRLSAMTVDSAQTHALVADYGYRAIVRVDLTTGDRTTVSSATIGAGPALVVPSDIVLDERDPAQVLVVDSSLDALLAVDLATGDRTVLADASTGNGPIWRSPSSIAIDRDDDIILVAESRAQGILGGVFMVDRQTGERVVMWY